MILVEEPGKQIIAWQIYVFWIYGKKTAYSKSPNVTLIPYLSYCWVTYVLPIFYDRIDPGLAQISTN